MYLKACISDFCKDSDCTRFSGPLFSQPQNFAAKTLQTLQSAWKTLILYILGTHRNITVQTALKGEILPCIDNSVMRIHEKDLEEKNPELPFFSF